MTLFTLPQAFDLGEVHLRRFTDDDVEIYARFRSLEAIWPWLPPSDLEKAGWEGVARDAIERFNESWDIYGCGPYAVTLKDGGEIVGHFGIRYLEEFEAAEIMYALDPSLQGRGIATRIGEECLRLSFEDMDQTRVIAFALPSNKASIRVMAKLGLSFIEVTNFRGGTVERHGLDRADWKKRIDIAS